MLSVLLFLLFGLFFLSFGTLTYLRHRRLAEKLSDVERIGWTAGTMAAVAVLVNWLFPDMSFAGKFALAVPMVIVVLVAVVWPDRKGKIDPYDAASNRVALRRQRINLFVLVDANAIALILIFTLAFPDQTPSFLKSRQTPLFLPSVFSLQNLILVEFVALALLLVALRHYVHSLPPKVDDTKKPTEETSAVVVPKAATPKVVRKTVQIVSCLFCGEKYYPTALELLEAHYVGLNHPITCRNCGKTATVVDVIEED